MTVTPEEIDVFWDAMDRDLTSVSLDLTLDHDSFYSQPEWSVYRMRYDSLDGYRLFAWVTVPSGYKGEKIPAVLRMPDYAGVHDLIYTPLRQDALVMNATYRGQRNSDSTFQAQYPGMLTQGIDRPETYVMRRAFGDALRAVDALIGQGEIGIGAVALMGSGLGGSLALAAASRRSAVKAVAADTPLVLTDPAAVEGGPTYPLAELEDYLRLNPGLRDSVLANIAPLDPVKIARHVEPRVLLSLGSKDRGQCPLSVGRALADLLPQCDLRVYEGAGEGGGHEHSVVRTSWIKEQLEIF